MNLSKNKLQQINSQLADTPAENYFELPEKVLQFGTGVLLRGLPDYFIDKANKQGLFNGRIAVIKSTATGSVDAFEHQDNLYTICVRGTEDGKHVEENIINASISRVLSAKDNWDEILKCAGNTQMRIVISNTTEVGIQLMKDNVHASPPVSFPGKLLAFLYRRYKIFDGDRNKGMVIIPTELIPDNGNKLLSILLELAHQNGLETSFLDWLENHNYCCNSLVDRIVPGKLPAKEQAEVENALGYKDELMIMAEVYRLWAVQSSDEKVKDILSFSKADAGVQIVPDISIFRELKLRLLNGSHTFSCGLAHLAGFAAVKEAMDDENFSSFITSLMLEEIAPAITDKNLSPGLAKEFAGKVLDRYRNPYIDHQWLSITMQYTSKMAMRNVPVLLRYYECFGTVPQHMALGFAAFILFMKTARGADGKYYGTVDGKQYPVNDDHVVYFGNKWQSDDSNVALEVLSDRSLWNADLNSLPGFTASVQSQMHTLIDQGSKRAIKILIDEKKVERV